MPPNEAKTRQELIDPALAKAGWDVGNADQVGIEVPVDGSNMRQTNILQEWLAAGEEMGKQNLD